MFQQFWSSNGTFFGDMTHQQDRRCRLFGVLDQFCGTFANLRNTPGRRVDVIIVRENGTVRDMQRMTGIVIRIDPNGVALVTYKSGELKRQLSGQENNVLASSESHSKTS